jgi:hypothetical protein
VTAPNPVPARRRTARVFTVIGAMAACAWMGLNLQHARAIDDARERIFNSDALTLSEAADIESELDRASFLNPDQTVDILRAGLSLRRGRSDEARQTLLDVVRREPENLEAWTAIAIGFARTDPALADRARAAIRRLSPLGQR